MTGPWFTSFYYFLGFLFFFFDVDHLFKIFTEFVTILFQLYVLAFWPLDMWDLSFPNRDWTHTPCIGKWSPNHWTTREVSTLILKQWVLPHTELGFGTESIHSSCTGRLLVVWRSHCWAQLTWAEDRPSAPTEGMRTQPSGLGFYPWFAEGTMTPALGGRRGVWQWRKCFIRGLKIWFHLYFAKQMQGGHSQAERTWERAWSYYVVSIFYKQKV